MKEINLNFVQILLCFILYFTHSFPELGSNWVVVDVNDMGKACPADTQTHFTRWPRRTDAPHQAPTPDRPTFGAGAVPHDTSLLLLLLRQNRHLIKH